MLLSNLYTIFASDEQLSHTIAAIKILQNILTVYIKADNIPHFLMGRLNYFTGNNEVFVSPTCVPYEIFPQSFHLKVTN